MLKLTDSNELIRQGILKICFVERLHRKSKLIHEHQPRVPRPTPLTLPQQVHRAYLFDDRYGAEESRPMSSTSCPAQEQLLGMNHLCWGQTALHNYGGRRRNKQEPCTSTGKLPVRAQHGFNSGMGARIARRPETLTRSQVIQSWILEGVLQT